MVQSGHPPHYSPEGIDRDSISNRRIDLAWTDRSSAESGYTIEQSLDGATGWTQVGSTAANVTSYAAPGPFLEQPPTTSGFGPRTAPRGYSTTAAATTPAYPNAPTGVTATGSEGTVTLELGRRQERDQLSDRTRAQSAATASPARYHRGRGDELHGHGGRKTSDFTIGL